MAFADSLLDGSAFGWSNKCYDLTGFLLQVEFDEPERVGTPAQEFNSGERQVLLPESFNRLAAALTLNQYTKALTDPDPQCDVCGTRRPHDELISCWPESRGLPSDWMAPFLGAGKIDERITLR
jgi:hypothetical protein